MTNVISHPAFDREPIANARRHGPCPKSITSIRRYQRHKSDEAVLKQRQAQHESWEERARRLERKLDVISWHLLQAAKVMSERGPGSHG
jgi:hypothetical protein